MTRKELPKMLEVERIKFLRLWYKYHAKYKIPFSHDDADDFFQEVCLIFKEEK